MATLQSHPGVTIWVDVEDFLDYFVANKRPSGIQRVAFEIMGALRQAEAGRVRFAQRGAESQAPLREVPWADLAAAMQGERLPEPKPVEVIPPEPGPEPPPRRRLVDGLPEHIRTPLVRAGSYQAHATESWRELARALRDARGERPQDRPEEDEPEPSPPGTVPDTTELPIRPGDPYLVLGAPWAVPGFGPFLSQLKKRYGVEAHLLLYDLIPIRHPEWCTKQAVALFRSWLGASLPLFDGLMAISRHTADDVEAYAREQGIALGGAVRPIPMGSGFGSQMEPSRPPPGLPEPGSYVLFVSTLEVRKNHELAFRVWRKLVGEMWSGARPAGSVPTLVFAGRVGWLVSDLLEQLENTSWLQGYVRLLADPTDAEIRALYQGCLFTLMPSWFEGWGLPVTESLALGKPCFASSATALPEAGGSLCRYFDPGNVTEAHRAIAAVLDAPGEIAAWQDRVRREFHPVSWSETARAVVRALRPVPA